MKILSIFGEYANNMQVLINSTNDRFAPTWYGKYFDYAPAQQTLSFTSVIGASRIEAAASIVNRSSEAPLRSRDELTKYQGEIPAIKEKFAMREEDYREFLAIQALSVSEEAKKKQLLDLLFNDIQKAGNAPHKRLDIMALEAISSGKISLTIDNNPDGIVLKDSLDLLMPAGNKKTAKKVWSNADATPISDIEGVVNNARAKGRSFSKILMDTSTFLVFAKNKEVVDSLISFNQLQKGASVATLAKINEYLEANLLPVIELVNETVGIEKDGVVSGIKPFNAKNLSFIPDGKLGVIKNALAMEQMKPVKHVNYGVFNRALLSKWQENDPWAEFTSVELNAFPTLEAIDNIFLLTVL